MNLKQIKRMFKTEYTHLPEHWLQDWLLHIICQPASFLITDDAYELTQKESEQVFMGIKKMESGTPVAYLIGQQAFWSLNFFVNQHTLIPRPDTEVLVENVLTWLSNNQPSNKSNSTQTKLLDLGTGTGCIAISLAKELPHWQVVAVDISSQALQVAQKNVHHNQVTNVTLIQSHWYQQLPIPTSEHEKFTIIVSNPPYIDKQDKHLDQLQAEPLTALVADNDGLADIEHILQQAHQYLLPDGLMVIEHGHNQAEAVQALYRQYGFYQVLTLKDYGGNDRITMAQLNL